MSRFHSARAPLALASLLGAAALASCVVIDTDSHAETTGTKVSPATLAEIEPGRPADFVVALLGEPSATTTLADGTEIWKWSYRETKTSGGHILFVLDADSTRETIHTTYVELCDGRVVKAWQD
jgi:outer membrane protein assembly factor BamE (lipoprotein component of BamABCDE complex)